MRSPFASGVGGVLSADIAVPEHERELGFYARILTTGSEPLWRDDLTNNRGTPVIGLGARTPEYEALPLQWMPHFQVLDVGASVARALELELDPVISDGQVGGQPQRGEPVAADAEPAECLRVRPAEEHVGRYRASLVELGQRCRHGVDCASGERALQGQVQVRVDPAHPVPEQGVDGGEQAELYAPDDFRYLSLQFDGDRLVGANAVGLSQHVGILRGLIQRETRLGAWKDRLMHDPTRLMEAYLATTQVA